MENPSCRVRQQTSQKGLSIDLQRAHFNNDQFHIEKILNDMKSTFGGVEIQIRPLKQDMSLDPPAWSVSFASKYIMKWELIMTIYPVFYQGS